MEIPKCTGKKKYIYKNTCNIIGKNIKKKKVTTKIFSSLVINTFSPLFSCFLSLKIIK